MTVVGKKGCRIKDLLERVMTDDMLSVSILERWQLWALKLDIPFTKRDRLSQEILLGTMPIANVFERVLYMWVEKSGNNATLEQLVKSFRDLNMENIAQTLEVSFFNEEQAPELQTDIHDNATKEALIKGQVNLYSSNSKKKRFCNKTKLLNTLLPTLASLLTLGITFIVIRFISGVSETEMYGEGIPDKLSFTVFQNTSYEQHVEAKPDNSISKIGDKALTIVALSFSDYERDIINFNVSIYNSIHVRVMSLMNWPSKFNMKQNRYISNLDIFNVTNKYDIFPILKQTTNLKNLSIFGSLRQICRKRKNRSDIKIDHQLEKTVYPLLRKLEFSNILPCHFNYSFFSESFEFKSLSRLLIINSYIDDVVIEFVRKLMVMSSTTLSTLKIQGTSNAKQIIFRKNAPLLNVKKLYIDLKNINPDIEYQILGKHVCSLLPNVTVFKSKTAIEYVDFLNILKCKQIRHVSAYVSILKTSELLNMNSAYKGNELESVDLVIEFKSDCPPCYKLDYLGLPAFKKRVKQDISITFVNCKCESEEELTYVSLSTDSFEIEFVKNHINN